MVSRLKQLTEQKHCTLSAEPETLQNIYKLHKCCIKRIFFFEIKYILFSWPQIGWSLIDYSPTPTCKGSPDRTFWPQHKAKLPAVHLQFSKALKTKAKKKKKPRNNIAKSRTSFTVSTAGIGIAWRCCKQQYGHVKKFSCPYYVIRFGVTPIGINHVRDFTPTWVSKKNKNKKMPNALSIPTPCTQRIFFFTNNQNK